MQEPISSIRLGADVAEGRSEPAPKAARSNGFLAYSLVDIVTKDREKRVRMFKTLKEGRNSKIAHARGPVLGCVQFDELRPGERPFWRTSILNQGAGSWKTTGGGDDLPFKKHGEGKGKVLRMYAINQPDRSQFKLLDNTSGSQFKPLSDASGSQFKLLDNTGGSQTSCKQESVQAAGRQEESVQAAKVAGAPGEGAKKEEKTTGNGGRQAALI
ncbi:hypothetical protein PG991_009081 [Apiospora marii]|uniref:Uncharacterized protein n=1 Tax=Apiospora marii TaxID=335849 RepID=A0ABR1RJZ1_9PEZI